MIFWSLCAFIWFRNIEKMLLQMTSGFLQLESTLCIINYHVASGKVVHSPNLCVIMYTPNAKLPICQTRACER
jgi:hypothetical protein